MRRLVQSQAMGNGAGIGAALRTATGGVRQRRSTQAAAGQQERASMNWKCVRFALGAMVSIPRPDAVNDCDYNTSLLCVIVDAHDCDEGCMKAPPATLDTAKFLAEQMTPKGAQQQGSVAPRAGQSIAELHG
jgi:hypothetical protein